MPLADLPVRERPALGGVDARLGQLKGLKHRLVVLMLVLRHHLPHRPDARHPVEDRERALTRLLHEGDRLVAPQIWQIAPRGTGRLGRVINLCQIRS